jgi:hypothetical protein
MRPVWRNNSPDQPLETMQSNGLIPEQVKISQFAGFRWDTFVFCGVNAPAGAHIIFSGSS